jgi:hypothetical protein
MNARDARLRQATNGQKLSLESSIGTIGLGSLLTPPLSGRLRRLSQVGLHPGPGHLPDHEPPPRAALHRQRHVLPPGKPLRQPTAKHLPAGRTSLPPAYLTGVGVQIVERDLRTSKPPTISIGDLRELLFFAQSCCACAEGVPSHVIFQSVRAVYRTRLTDGLLNMVTPRWVSDVPMSWCPPWSRNRVRVRRSTWPTRSTQA